MSPRNSSGTMSATNGPYTSGTTIVSAQINSRFADEEAELTDSLSRSGKGGMLASLRTIDGTVAAPAVAFTAEPASGLYRAAANDVRLAVGGVDALKLVAGGVAELDLPTAASGLVKATATGAQLQLQGNRNAADATPDVAIAATAARTAGTILEIYNGPQTAFAPVLSVDYQGLVRLLAPAAAIQPASIWTAITPNAGWTASNGLAYWKDPNGMVHVKGYLVAGTGVSPAFTLPAGFRPAALREWATHNNVHTANIFVQVDSTGTVSVASPTGPVDGYVDCVHFLAEA